MSTHFPPVFDGHNDTVLELMSTDPSHRRSFFERNKRGHIDLPRIRDGGFGGGIFAMFVPSPKTTGAAPKSATYAAALPDPLPLELSQQHAMRAFATLLDVERQAEGAVCIVRTANELKLALDEGVVAIVLHFEGAEPIDTDLAALPVFYAAGLRSLGLVWSRPNAFANGVPFAFPASPDQGPGLTDAGHRLVRACNDLGIAVDLSHLNEQGFWEVAALSQAPLIASHSGAHALCASTRNLTDRQLDAIRDSQGLVGVNFHVGFLRADGQVTEKTSLAEIVRHVDYMVERMGIDHVGLGSDFDGATMPGDLKDVAGLPKLMTALSARGYTEKELAKIANGNWQRVLAATWKE